MRYGIALLVTALVVLSGFNFKVSSEDNSFQIITEGNYDIIYMENASLTHKTGYPMLPYKTKTYTFPLGTRIKDVKVVARNVQKIKLDKKIAPSPPPVPMGGENVDYGAEEGSIYSTDTFYPYSWYDYTMKGGIKDGVRLLFLTIHLYPVRYNAVKNEAMYAKNFRVKIDYDVKASLSPTSSYDLLIIAPDEWIDELQTLKEHKESHGVRTLMEGLNEIYGKYSGRDEAESIKYAIKDAIEKYGIKYVLLVGDANKMPVRYSYVYDGEEAKFASDLYYADIYDSEGKFSSWDTNDNKYFGEYNHNGQRDDVDGYPDVYVGRIACGTDTELKNVLNKIISYENIASGTQWVKRAAAFGGDTHEDNKGVYEGELIKEKAFSYLSSFDREYFFTSDGTLSKSSIKSQFNEGGGIFNFEGHGNRVSWATHPPKEFDTWIGFDITDVASFSNKEKTPVVIISACDTGQFDKGACLAWQLVKKSSGGSIATLAASALSWGYTGKYAPSGLSGYMDVLLCKNFKMGSSLGEMWGDSIGNYITYQRMDSAFHYKTIEEWTLFGDPSLKIGGYSTTSPVVYLDKPNDGYLYFANREIMPTPFGRTVIIGKITIEVAAYNVERVEFYVDGKLKYTDEEKPYEWLWNEFAFGSHEIKIVGYGKGEEREVVKDVIIFNL